MNLPEIIRPVAISWHPTGSRYICTPEPEGTEHDRDFIVQVEETELSGIAEFLAEDGWQNGGSADEDEDFVSYKKVASDGITDNLILTHTKSYYHKFVAMTTVAKRLNLLDKADRVVLFRAGLHSEYDEQYSTTNRGVSPPSAPSWARGNLPPIRMTPPRPQTSTRVTHSGAVVDSYAIDDVVDTARYYVNETMVSAPLAAYRGR